MRSLSWLRKGISENDAVDEFVSYWVGLEVLRGLLRRQLKMKVKDPSEWQAIENIFVNSAKMDLQNVLDARNALLHGYQELSNEFVKEITSYVEPTRKALIIAISQVLGLENQTVNRILQKSLRRRRMEDWIAIEADIQTPSPVDENVLMDQFPRVVPSILGTKFSLEENGNLSVSHQVEHRFVGPAGIKWGNIAFEHWGDPDIGINSSDISVSE